MKSSLPHPLMIQLALVTKALHEIHMLLHSLGSGNEEDRYFDDVNTPKERGWDEHTTKIISEIYEIVSHVNSGTNWLKKDNNLPDLLDDLLGPLEHFFDKHEELSNSVSEYIDDFNEINQGFLKWIRFYTKVIYPKKGRQKHF